MGKLSTHILDTTHGCPAANVTVELWSIEQSTLSRHLMKTVITNADGRTDVPLLVDAEVVIGTYELVFNIGEYFGQYPDLLTDPPFLNRIPVQFAIANTTAHYHVPLLVSPWSYSTYRGS